MTYADKLAARVKNVLKRQVQDKGYEVDAVLSKKKGNIEKLGISDTGEDTDIAFSNLIKIIITSHDVELFPMELGDNPDDILDFIWIGDESISTDKHVNEAMTLTYLDNEYTVTIASPTNLGTNLVIKECRAKKVR